MLVAPYPPSTYLLTYLLIHWLTSYTGCISVGMICCYRCCYLWGGCLCLFFCSLTLCCRYVSRCSDLTLRRCYARFSRPYLSVGRVVVFMTSDASSVILNTLTICLSGDNRFRFGFTKASWWLSYLCSGLRDVLATLCSMVSDAIRSGKCCAIGGALVGLRLDVDSCHSGCYMFRPAFAKLFSFSCAVELESPVLIYVIILVIALLHAPVDADLVYRYVSFCCCLSHAVWSLFFKTDVSCELYLILFAGGVALAADLRVRCLRVACLAPTHCNLGVMIISRLRGSYNSIGPSTIGRFVTWGKRDAQKSRSRRFDATLFSTLERKFEWISKGVWMSSILCVAWGQMPFASGWCFAACAVWVVLFLGVACFHSGCYVLRCVCKVDLAYFCSSTGVTCSYLHYYPCYGSFMALPMLMSGRWYV